MASPFQMSCMDALKVAAKTRSSSSGWLPSECSSTSGVWPTTFTDPDLCPSRSKKQRTTGDKQDQCEGLAALASLNAYTAVTPSKERMVSSSSVSNSSSGTQEPDEAHKRRPPPPLKECDESSFASNEIQPAVEGLIHKELLKLMAPYLRGHKEQREEDTTETYTEQSKWSSLKQLGGEPCRTGKTLCESDCTLSGQQSRSDQALPELSQLLWPEGFSSVFTDPTQVCNRVDDASKSHYLQPLLANDNVEADQFTINDFLEDINDDVEAILESEKSQDLLSAPPLIDIQAAAPKLPLNLAEFLDVVTPTAPSIIADGSHWGAGQWDLPVSTGGDAVTPVGGIAALWSEASFDNCSLGLSRLTENGAIW